MVESSDHDLPRAIEGLVDREARDVALAYAPQRGVPDPQLNALSHTPYPVNAVGTSLDQVVGHEGKPPPAGGPLMQPHRYRLDVPVVRRFG